MSKFKYFIFSILALMVFSTAAFAEEADKSGSRLRKFNDEPEIEESTEPLFDEDGLFLDEIEPGFFKRGWKQVVVAGNQKSQYITQNGSLLHFDLPRRETYAYVMNEREPANDMYVEAEFIINNDYKVYHVEYGVACRVSDEGWYELRVQTTGDTREMGSFKIYKYDPSLKARGRNPYVLIHTGFDFYKTVDLKNGYGKRNVIGLSCVDDTIEVYINGKQQIPVKGLVWTDSQFTQGGFGAGALVYGDDAAEFDLAYIAAELQ